MRVEFNGIFVFSVNGKSIRFENEFETDDPEIIKKLKLLGFKDKPKKVKNKSKSSNKAKSKKEVNSDESKGE